MTDVANVLIGQVKYRIQEWAEIHRRCKELELSNREFAVVCGCRCLFLRKIITFLL